MGSVNCLPLGFVPVDARASRPRCGHPPKCSVWCNSGLSLPKSKCSVNVLECNCSSSSSLPSCAKPGPAQASVRKQGRPSRKPPKLSIEVSPPDRVTRSQLKRSSVSDARTLLLFKCQKSKPRKPDGVHCPPLEWGDAALCRFLLFKVCGDFHCQRISIRVILTAKEIVQSRVGWLALGGRLDLTTLAAASY
eukprot:scpid69831/ scgid31000/ 